LLEEASLRRWKWDVVRVVGQREAQELRPTEILQLEVVELASDSRDLPLAVAAGCSPCSCFLFQLLQPQTAEVQI